ncbi:ImmA/IrrE family metallo-endopeptidase [Actinomyces sp. 565]|uniref:ImmA/IrrE family metallo-endopeptidase n=1 Tax=Actinomyces sp. 565 TaxID=2057794 RepID=UPI0013A6C3D9|nr:ImmA/IrrE family metallo-endopeptidase [Actinomyces sp. 565]NDR53958.1 ImmA/IrrE family metallo-endopeptidase [Actinomyces sp. 565]
MSIHPTRVTIARERGGLSRLDLATAVGVSTRTLANWEDSGAPDTRADALSTATAQPVAFFQTNPAAAVTDDLIFFRTRRRTSAALLHRATALGALGMEMFNEMSRRLGLPVLALPELDPSLSPQAAAEAVRRQWALGDFPLPNLVQLVESHGIRVLGIPAAEQDVDAFSFWGQDARPYVFLARRKTPERSRFDLAHELGHLLMHSSTKTDAATDRELEREANVFAATLLLPPDSVRAMMPSAPPLDAVVALARHFGTSAVAAAHSVHDVGRASDWGHRQLMAELTRRGFETGEPGSSLPYERSRIHDALVKHLRQSRITTTAWARAIGQRPDDVAAFTLGQALSVAP